MKIELGQTIQILANVGVVAGIIFLIVELRQNNAALESQSRMNHADTRSEYFNRLSTDPVLMPIVVKAQTGQSLDDVEEARLIAHYVAMFIGWQWEWEEHERGRLELPEAAWRSTFTAGNVGPGNSPAARRAWEQNRESFLPGFAAYMEDVILK